MQAYSHDIIVVGGGMVGLTAACALAKQTHLSIAVLEANPESEYWSFDHYHHRVSAISLSSMRIFQSLDVWQNIKAKRVSPFKRIHVWDGLSYGKLDFNSADVGEPLLGYIVENNAIVAALLEKLKTYQNVEFIAPVALVAASEQGESVNLVAADGREFSARLVVAADGARSWLREKADIQVVKSSYDQKAIVATVTTSLPHQQTARQVFLQTGPLAFLPLQEPNTSSIVWSLPTDQAEAMLLLSDEQFRNELSLAFSHSLGEVLSVSKRYAFPLQKQQVSTYFHSHIVLIGDAAHTVHPLAGQGVNMGLLDAACLVDVIADAYKKQRDYASVATLRRYERWRKADNAAMLKGVDVIKHLFASDKKTIQAFRSYGLSMVDAIPLIKNIFIRQAVGNRGDLPVMAQLI